MTYTSHIARLQRSLDDDCRKARAPERFRMPGARRLRSRAARLVVLRCRVAPR